MTSNQSTSFSEADCDWMLRALALAAGGLGNVEPNPMVGAIIVADGKAVGQGCHEAFGGPHAEVNALAAAGESARGSTLYVTLEPCCHRGKTGPCCEAILSAGVTRVACAMIDPFDQVAGRGIARLREAGVRVDVGCCEEAARRLNAAYLKLIEQGRPWVIAKWAQTLDGCLASPKLNRWITGDAALDEAHRLRAQCQAILVGAGTVLADDPSLTTRRVEGRSPHRWVLDGRLLMPEQCKLVRTVGEVPVTVATTMRALDGDPSKAARLRSAGVELVPLADVPPLTWSPILEEMGRRRVTRLLVEGGGQVLRSVLAERQADELAVFVAPKFAGEGLRIFDGSLEPFVLVDVQKKELPPDALVRARIEYRSQT